MNEERRDTIEEDRHMQISVPELFKVDLFIIYIFHLVITARGNGL